MENLAVQEPKKISIGNFLNFPNTQKFLEDNLKENRKEFVSNLLALCDGDANLALCEPNKLMMCAMNATALNLPLNKNLGYAYIIPYKGVPSFQIGYKGLIQLALRSGQYKFLNATEVREGEISRNKFTGEIKFLGENEDAKIIGYMACLELNNGFRASLYMTEAEIEKHAMRFSKMYAADKQYSKRVSKWSDPDARPKMAIKTVLKGLLGTYGVLSTEMVKAFANDDDNESEPTKSNGRTGDIEEAVIVQNEPELETEKVEI
ncbi:MAG: recombinase RecT [Flavobacterium sp.]|nr:recombinase RecT [Flavobacterium sp.]